MKRGLIIFGVVCMLMTFAVQAEQGPSEWIKTEVQDAVDAGLVPQELQSNWQEDITRQEFCKLVVTLLEKRGYDFEETNGWKNEVFLDTKDENVKKAKFLGIVNGRQTTDEGSYFVPQASITRQEAAKMLYALTETSVIPNAKVSQLVSHVFDDRNAPPVYIKNGLEKSYIATWARTGIDFCYNTGVMNGVGDNCFEPNGMYTREQACVTMLRLHKWADGGGNTTKIADRRFLFLDEATGLYGYKNIEGKIVIPAQFSSQGFYMTNLLDWDVNSNYQTVSNEDGSFCVIDRSGDVIMQDCEARWDSVGIKISGNKGTLVSLPEGTILADNIMPGDTCRNGFQKYYQLEEDAAGRILYDKSKVGFLDENGYIVISAKYYQVGDFFDGVAIAILEQGDVPVLIDETGNILSNNCGIDLTKYDYAGFGWGRYLVMYDADYNQSLWSFEGKVILSKGWQYIMMTQDGNFIAGDSNTALGYLYDRNGKPISLGFWQMNTCLPLYGRYGFSFSDGISVNGDGYYRLCNESGRKINDTPMGDIIGDGGNTMIYRIYIDPSWNNSGLAVQAGEWQIIVDDLGNELWRINAPEAFFSDGSVCVVNFDGSIGYYSSTGIKLID